MNTAHATSLAISVLVLAAQSSSSPLSPATVASHSLHAPGHSGSVSEIGDVDADGRNDLAIIERGVLGNIELQIRARSNFALIRTHTFPSSVVSAFQRTSDLNGDGVEDYAVGVTTYGLGQVNFTRAYSGATGYPIFETGQASSRWITSIVEIGDVNDDGVPDLVTHASNRSSRGQAGGTLRLISGRDGEPVDLSSGALEGTLARVRQAVEFPAPWSYGFGWSDSGDCTPQYQVTHTQPSAGCAEVCYGVYFSSPAITSSNNNDGSCHWSYSFTREPDGEKFDGKFDGSCPSSKTLNFYCDAAENCLLMTITFTCKVTP